MEKARNSFTVCTNIYYANELMDAERCKLDYCKAADFVRSRESILWGLLLILLEAWEVALGKDKSGAFPEQ